jgi:C-terminal processing protease CtpA/Prc
MLPGGIGYADLQRLPVSMVDSMFNTFKNTKAIIFDMRGYPQGTAWEIAPRLTEKNYVEAALFTRVMATKPLVVSQLDEVKPNTVYSYVQTLPTTVKWRYKGKTIMLMDEETQSQAEHTGLFFKAANGTKFVGSQTAGANGDITNFVIPGSILLSFSGQTVSYPNGQPMQRVGLEPDIEVHPTIRGIREGKDEVLDKAIQVLKKEKR